MPVRPDVSLILPTFNERESLRLLRDRIDSALGGYRYEVIVVDDNSPDGTAEQVREFARDGPYRLLLRPYRLGLSSAVLDGFACAEGETLAVMDADGSHPPEFLPSLLDPILGGRVEFVLASRRVPGASDAGLTVVRYVTSWMANAAARGVAAVRDPMSGFFSVRRQVLGRAPLRRSGFKIGLEILAKCRPDPVLEIPFGFGPRLAGDSKLDPPQIFDYLLQLADLYRWRVAADHRASRTR